VTLAEYEAQVKAVESGASIQLITLAESTTHVEALIRGEDWQTADEEERGAEAHRPLARLRWSLESQPSGETPRRGEACPSPTTPRWCRRCRTQPGSLTAAWPGRQRAAYG
jgi:hypothetical protein